MKRGEFFYGWLIPIILYIGIIFIAPAFVKIIFIILGAFIGWMTYRRR